MNKDALEALKKISAQVAYNNCYDDNFDEWYKTISSALSAQVADVEVKVYECEGCRKERRVVEIPSQTLDGAKTSLIYDEDILTTPDTITIRRDVLEGIKNTVFVPDKDDFRKGYNQAINDILETDMMKVGNDELF